ncbi:uncharacterized protein [Antedon mediterranea]|uniref:uncharacterized protein isoform X2 n=1 Tax=Antedon mediterranea TaxID=105859 RepID=UPI003AF74298
MSKTVQKMDGEVSLSKRLKDEGLESTSSDKEKMQKVWKWYKKADNELKSARKEIEELKKQQAQEMKEVENYVEHIRNLSEEREVLTQEFEKENERLKDENETLKKELAGDNKEIAMLLQQEGLEDIASGTQSEQIAYLLVERAKLLDDLDMERKKKAQVGNYLDNKKVERLEREKRRLDDELKKEKENSKKILESNAKLHEEQLKIMQTRRDKLEQENRELKAKLKGLESHVSELSTDLDKTESEKYAHANKALQQQKQETSLLKKAGLENSQLKESRKRLELEMTTMKHRLKTSEEEKTSLDTKIRELQTSLDDEKKKRSSHEATIIKLRALIDKNKKQLNKLEETSKTVKDDKKALELKLEYMEKDIESLKGKEHNLTSQMENKTKTERDLVEKQQNELQRLKEENQKVIMEHKSALDLLEREKKRAKELDNRGSASEQEWRRRLRESEERERELAKKLDDLRADLESAREDTSTGRTDFTKMQNEIHEELSTSQTENRQLREQMAREKALMEDSESRNKRINQELEKLIDDLKKDRDVLARELQTMITKDQQANMLVGEADKLLLDKKDLQEQLDSSKRRNTQLSDDLQLDRTKITDLTSEIAFLKEKLKLSEGSVKKLKEEINQKSLEVSRNHDISSQGQTNMDVEIVRVQREMISEREKFGRENNELKWQLDRADRKTKDLQETISEKNEEVSQLRKENTRLCSVTNTGDSRLEDEIRLRNDVEGRNKVLEEEMTKLWNQMKDLLEKLTNSEAARQELETEIERQNNTIRLRDSEFERHKAEVNVSSTALGKVQHRAQSAERRIPELQQEVDDMSLKLQTAEQQLKDYEATRIEVQNCREEILKYKSQIQEDRIQRSLQNQHIEELKSQLDFFRNKEDQLHHNNSELKHKYLETQNKLHTIEDQNKSISEMQSVSEKNKQVLSDQLSSLRNQVDRLQMEVFQTTEKLQLQMHKYDDQKRHHRSKLQAAREIFTRHKLILTESLNKLQEELTNAKRELQHEQQWKNNMDTNHKQLLSEHRELLAKFSENEELTRDQSRNLATMEYRLKFLEYENGVLQERVDVLSKQRIALEKLVREYRLEKQKEEINKAVLPGSLPITHPMSSFSYGAPKGSLSSGLGNSMSYAPSLDLSSHRPEGLLTVRSPGSAVYSPHINGYVNNARNLSSTGRTLDNESTEVDSES